MARRKRDPKAEALRRSGCLHPHPEKVTDVPFSSSDFFDARDLLQVKYEMLRRVRVDGRTVSASAASFGLSRPSFYQVSLPRFDGHSKKREKALGVIHEKEQTEAEIVYA